MTEKDKIIKEIEKLIDERPFCLDEDYNENCAICIWLNKLKRKLGELSNG